MIVRSYESARLLITQPDHAALAGRIITRWQADGFDAHPRRRAILAAVDRHDDGWRDVDAAPLVEEQSGRILDFIEAPGHIKRDVWPRAVRRLSPTPYAAALVAQHGLHVYRRYRADPEWVSFFEHLEAERGRLLLDAGVTHAELLGDYLFVRVGDLISLTFCNGWTDPQTDDSGSPYAIRWDGTQVLVAPDPFGGARIPIEISAREIPNRPFQSASEAREAFATAPVRTLSGVVLGGSR